MPPKSTQSGPETRTLVFVIGDDQYRMDIPHDARVTLAPFFGKPTGSDFRGRPVREDEMMKTALRIYKNANVQLACIRGVSNFWDATMPPSKIEEEATSTLTNAGGKRIIELDDEYDDDGDEEDFEAEVRAAARRAAVAKRKPAKKRPF